MPYVVALMCCMDCTAGGGDVVGGGGADGVNAVMVVIMNMAIA